MRSGWFPPGSVGIWLEAALVIKLLHAWIQRHILPSSTKRYFSSMHTLANCLSVSLVLSVWKNILLLEKTFTLLPYNTTQHVSCFTLLYLAHVVEHKSVKTLYQPLSSHLCIKIILESLLHVIKLWYVKVASEIQKEILYHKAGAK